jgi:uncharacterized protein YraI
MTKLLVSALLAASALTASAAVADQAWVGNNHLNARSGPGVGYDLLGTFNPCTPVDVIEYQYGWARVSHDNNNYWVSSQYLQDYACAYTPPKQTYTPPKPTYTPPKQTYTPPKSNY